MKTFFIYDTPFGPFVIAERGGGICDIKLASRWQGGAEQRKETPLIKRAAKQLKAYFTGQLKKFDLPLAPIGTPFQLAVWGALGKIPYGQTRSYKDIAAAIGKPKAMRAVGGANNKNPITIVVPCHRVIGADGSLVGYGLGLPLKERLLKLEGCL